MRRITISSAIAVTLMRGTLGERVAETVVQLSDDPRITDYSERKVALRQQVESAGGSTACAYAAAKVAKVRELGDRIASRRLEVLEGMAEQRSKYRQYVTSLLMLERVTGGHPLTRRLRFELETLSTLPPDGRTLRFRDVAWSARLPNQLVERSSTAA